MKNFQQTKRDELLKAYQLLLSQYAAVEAERRTELDPSDRVILENKRDELEKQIQTLETEIAELEKQPALPPESIQLTEKAPAPTSHPILKTKHPPSSYPAITIMLLLIMGGISVLIALLNFLRPFLEEISFTVPNATDFHSVTSSGAVHALALQEDGTLWFVQTTANDTQVLYSVKTSNGKESFPTRVAGSPLWNEEIAESGESILTMIADCRGTVWILVDNTGIYQYSAHQATERLFDKNAPELAVWQLIKDTAVAAAYQCIGQTVQVLFSYYESSGVYSLTYTDDPTQFTALPADTTNDLWNATQSFAHISVLERVENHLWGAGYFSEQRNQFERDAPRIFAANLASPTVPVQAYLTDYTDNGEGFFDIDGQDDQVWVAKASQLIEIVGAVAPRIHNLEQSVTTVEIGAKRLWLGADCTEITNCVSLQVSPLNTFQPQAINWTITAVYDMVTTPQGQVWLATDRGVYIYQP